MSCPCSIGICKYVSCPQFVCALSVFRVQCTVHKYLFMYTYNIYICCGFLTTGVLLGLWYNGLSYGVELYLLYYSTAVTTCKQWHCHCVNVPYNIVTVFTSPLAKTVSLCQSSWWSILVNPCQQAVCLAVVCCRISFAIFSNFLHIVVLII